MNNILIVGSYGTFTDELINKFHKENWYIYTLTTSKKRVKPAHVFEQYVFQYNSNNIKDIISNCRPDVVVFSGAYDPLYKWEEDTQNEDSLGYISGLSNLLMCSAISGAGHFIYVSSDKVFEDEYIVDIREEMPVTPNSFKGMTISQGENMTMHFGQTTQMETSVVRIAHMYGVPSDRASCTDIYSQMCVKVLVSGRISVNAKKVITALYINDAVEGLYLLISAPERKYSLYHISSMEEVTEDMIVGLIQENYSQPVEILDQTIGLRHRTVLSNERFSREFSFHVVNSCEKMIPVIISYMMSHKSHFLYNDEKYEGKGVRSRIYQLFKNIVPFLECIVFFIPFFMLNNRAAGSTYFDGINVYMLYVLLFAMIHGRQQAIFASLLSVLGYCFREMYTSTGFSLLININTYIWIAHIFIVGLTVGHLKDRFGEMELDKNEKIDFLNDRLQDITVINTSNTRIKNYYADKLISSKEGIGRIYDITSRLDRAETGEVLFVALDVLAEIMKTKDIAIYLVSNSNFCRLASASSQKASSLGKSVPVKKYSMIFDVLETKQVYINRSLDVNLPMMAGALYDDKDNMRIVIFLWDIPYERMTLYEANLLTVAGALVYSVVVREADYLDALAYRRFITETSILQESAFEEMVDIYKRVGEKGYADSTIFYVQKSSMSMKQLNDSIRPLLRGTDYMGIMQDGTLAILLTNTNEQEAVYVRNRLEEHNIITYLEKSV